MGTYSEVVYFVVYLAQDYFRLFLGYITSAFSTVEFIYTSESTGIDRITVCVLPNEFFHQKKIVSCA